MKRGLILSFLLVAAVGPWTAGFGIFGAPEAPAVRAGDQSWSTIPQPELAGAGNIRALAVVDASTAFAATSAALTASGSATSYLLRTTDGGASWSPVGTFDNQNPAAPTGLFNGPALGSPAADVFLALSPNYAADRTLFVAVSDPGFEGVYRSKNGGDSFAPVGARNFTGGERIRAISVAPSYAEATDYSVVVGTIASGDNVQGGLYFYQTSFGGGWTAKTGASDVYAVAFTGGNSLVVIGAADTTVGADPVAEFRTNMVSGIVSLPSSSPAMVPVGPSQPGSGQENLRFSLAFPSNWIPGTSSDTDVIAYSTGGPSPSGAIFRRSGLGYSTVSTSASHGFASLAMTGSAAGGRIFAGGEVAPGVPTALSQSMDGGRTWNDVSVGDRFGVDGVASVGVNMRVSVGVGGGAVFVGTGGVRGGVFKSPDLGATWADSALYSDAVGPIVADWEVADANSIFLLTNFGSGGRTYLFKTTDGGKSWRRVSRTPHVHSVRASRNFATDGTLWEDVLWVEGTTLNAAYLRRSVDGGRTWTPTPAYPSDADYAIVMVADTDARVWMAMKSGRVARTQDGGATWELSAPFGPGRIMASIVKSPDFAADNTLLGTLNDTPGTIWISRDAGASWAQFGAAPLGEGLGGVAFSPDYRTDRLVYAVTGGYPGGLWKLVDDGSATATSAWTGIATRAEMQIGARAGPPVFTDGIMYVPAGDRIVSSFDVKAARPEWRSSPVTSSDAPSGRVVARVVDGAVNLWTGGFNNSILTMTDAVGPIASPTATAGLGRPTATPVGARIALAEGWNLISVPRPLEDPSVAAVFASAPAVTTLYAFEDGNWAIASRTAGGWSGTLTQTVDGKGYFVYAAKASAVTLQFSASKSAAASYSLPAGWSLIGYASSLLRMPTGAYLANLGDSWTSLYRYDASQGWEAAKPGGLGFPHVEQGRGYWINLTEPGTLVP